MTNSTKMTQHWRLVSNLWWWRTKRRHCYTRWHHSRHHTRRPHHRHHRHHSYINTALTRYSIYISIHSTVYVQSGNTFKASEYSHFWLHNHNVWLSVIIYYYDCTPVSDIPSRCHLQSATWHHLTVPRYWLGTFGRRAFSVDGPTAWNSLPDSLRNPALSSNSFRKSLKTNLFRNYHSAHTAQ